MIKLRHVLVIGSPKFARIIRPRRKPPLPVPLWPPLRSIPSPQDERLAREQRAMTRRLLREGANRAAIMRHDARRAREAHP